MCDRNNTQWSVYPACCGSDPDCRAEPSGGGTAGKEEYREVHHVINKQESSTVSKRRHYMPAEVVVIFGHKTRQAWIFLLTLSWDRQTILEYSEW